MHKALRNTFTKCIFTCNGLNLSPTVCGMMTCMNFFDIQDTQKTPIHQIEFEGTIIPITQSGVSM